MSNAATGWLRLGDVIARLAGHPGYTKDRVRQLADAGLLRVTRPPKTGPGATHRRFESASVDELARALSLPAAEQAAALETIRARNQLLSSGLNCGTVADQKPRTADTAGARTEESLHHDPA